MNQPVKHDWPRMIAELEASGLTLYKIGLAIGLQWKQIKAVKDGGRIEHYHGELLRTFHAERTNVQSTDVSSSSLTGLQTA